MLEKSSQYTPVKASMMMVVLFRNFKVTFFFFFFFKFKMQSLGQYLYASLCWTISTPLVKFY